MFSLLFITVFFKLTLSCYFVFKARTAQHQVLLNSQKIFSKLGELALFSFDFSSLSSYRSAGFPDCLENLSKSGKCQPAVYFNEFSASPRNLSTYKIRRIAFAVLKSFW
jgi:hypothetical protein